jgi:hypothetical protein
MTSLSKNLLYGSAAVAILVALAALADIFTGIPFAQQILMDVMFLIGATFVLVMAWESYKEQT